MIVGIDVHKHTHAAALLDERSRQIDTLIFANRPEGYQRLFDWLTAHGAKQPGFASSAGGYGRCLVAARALPSDDGEGVGLRDGLPITPPSQPGAATLARALQPTKTPFGDRQPAADQPCSRGVGAGQLPQATGLAAIRRLGHRTPSMSTPSSSSASSASTASVSAILRGQCRRGTSRSSDASTAGWSPTRDTPGPVRPGPRAGPHRR